MSQNNSLISLKMETFSVDSPFYYNDAESARILELLRHLIQFGDEVLLLCGPEGSGRSAMLNKVVERASSQWQVCRIEAAANADAAMLILRFARCLGINMAKVEVGDIVTLLQRHLSSSDVLYLPVIIVDDAHRLNDEALEALLLLVQLRLDSERRVRLLLAGDTILHGRLQQPRLNAAAMVHRVDLQPYAHAEVEAYLKYRLSAAGYGGEFPFNRKQLRQIERESGGWPGKINEVARELMSRARAPVPLASRMLLLGGMASLLLALGAGSWLYWRGVAEPALSEYAAEPLLPPAATPLPPCSEDMQVEGCLKGETGTAPMQGETTANPQAEPSQPLVEPAAIPLVLPAPPESLPQAAVEVVKSEPPTASHKEAPAASVELLGNGWVLHQPREYYTLQLLVSAQPDIVYKMAETKQLPAPVAIATFTQEGRSFYALLQGSYASRSSAEEAVAPLKGASGQAPWVRSFSSLPPLAEAPSQPPAVAAPPEAASAHGLLGAAWLWSRNPGSYTLQLYGAGNESAILGYIEQHKLAGDMGMVKVERSGKPWFLLLQGEYPSRERAAQAVAALPAALKGSSPWERSFASVQGEMVNPARAPR